MMNAASTPKGSILARSVERSSLTYEVTRIAPTVTSAISRTSANGRSRDRRVSIVARTANQKKTKQGNTTTYLATYMTT